MAYRFILIAALVSCTTGAYIQQQSAASPSQIKYAEQQTYDQTGPGAVQKQAQPQPQQVSSQPYLQQQQLTAQQPLQYYRPQPFAQFQQQPQQQQYILPQASPQSLAFSHYNQLNSLRSSPPQQLVYSQQQAKYSHIPQVSFQYQPQDLKQIQANTLQQEYDAASQPSFEAPEGFASKFQYSQPQQVSSLVVHQPQHQSQPGANFFYQQAQQQTAPTVLKQVARPSHIFQTVVAPAPKPFFPTPVSPVANYKSNQHYAYSQ